MIRVSLNGISSCVDTQQLRTAHNWLQEGNGIGNDYTGWVNLPTAYNHDEFDRIKAAAAKIKSQSSALVVIGVGGSYLGARGVIEALCSSNYNIKKKDTPNIYFAGNNFSTQALDEIMQLVSDCDFSINVISKSGTTTEPAIAFRFFKELCEKKYGKDGAKERIYATTDSAFGALKGMADAEGYQTFVVPNDVGGRYSVLTPVGLLPIAVAGIDIDALMNGAGDMTAICARPGDSNPAWQYAAARNTLYSQGKSIELLASYEPAFRFMTEWWKQLFGESEGKDGKGLFPASCEFTADLHSMGQYIQQGQRLMFETIVRFDSPASRLKIPKDAENRDGLNFLSEMDLSHICRQAMDATLLAHLEGGVPNIIIGAGETCAYTIGELIYFFEYSCGMSGYLLGVNPFNQPGVEAYKVNMFALLGKPGYEAQKEALRKRLEQ